jgi:polyribonucleotide nucleotidyltransferase
MAAGVPLKAPVAGIAMGLITDGKGTYVVLSDIQGLEDHMGDMDFKVAGTKDGITALQMDIKIKGVPRNVMAQALEQARDGRLFILDKMLACIAEPRPQLSPFAPKIQQLVIPANRIGELIGPGGKNIRGLIELTGAQIDVEEDAETETGRVNISSTDQAQIDHAYKLVEGMMHEVQVGEEYDGKVVRIEAYGAFVNILPGKDGLVHVSAMGTEYVRDASDVVNMGDTVHVRVSEIQDDGKIKLTMLTPEQEAEAAQRRAERGGGDRGDRGDRGGFGGGYGGGDRPRRSFDRGGRGGDRGGRPPFRGGRGGFGGDRPRGRFGDRSRGSDRPRERFEDR